MAWRIGAIWGYSGICAGYLGLLVIWGLGIWRGLSRAIWGFSANYLGLFSPLPGIFWGIMMIYGYLGIWRGLSRVIWGFGVNYLGLFSPLLGIFWGIMMTITDLVTPPATRAVAPNRLLSSSLVSYFISMQESRMAFFDLYIGILVTSFHDPATDLISNLLRTFFRVSATHFFWGFRMDKYKPFDEEGARAQRKPHT